MNELFDKMVGQVLKYKPATKGKKGEREAEEKAKEEQEAQPKQRKK